MEMASDNPKTELTPVKPSRKGIISVISIAFILLGGCGGVIYYLFERQATWSNCASTFDFHYTKNGQDEVNVSKMVRVMQTIDFEPQYLNLYYSSFQVHNNSGAKSGKASITGHSDTPTHGCVKPPCSKISRRQLGTVEALATIGQEVGAVWNLVQADSDVSAGNWVGAVPSSMKTNWASLTGWQSYSVQPMGSNSPSCDSGWGNTYADWSVTWEGNGNYIENAKILASATAAWGMHVNVNAQASLTPLNIGTANTYTYGGAETDNTIAQVSFELTFQSQGGLASTYTESRMLYIDAQGNYHMDSATGSFC